MQKGGHFRDVLPNAGFTVFALSWLRMISVAAPLWFTVTDIKSGVMPTGSPAWAPIGSTSAKPSIALVIIFRFFKFSLLSVWGMGTAGNWWVPTEFHAIAAILRDRRQRGNSIIQSHSGSLQISASGLLSHQVAQAFSFASHQVKASSPSGGASPARATGLLIIIAVRDANSNHHEESKKIS